MNEFHLFAGIGGGILGGMLNGNIPVGAVEIEEYPRKVLIQRQIDGCLPVFPIWDDVCTFRADNEECRWFIEHLRSIRDDLRICGGFPCQDISAAGKGAGLDGERSGLWREFKRIISEIRPRNVFIENSPMLTVRGGCELLPTLPKWGTMRAGELYQQKTAVLGINGNASGVRQKFITPTASDGLRMRFKNESYLTEKRLTHSVGCLPEQLARMMFPTPTVCGNYNYKGCSPTSGDGLGTVVRKMEQGILTEEERKSFRAGNGGLLNPDWVEWLMGLPIGWTDLKALGMHKFLSWRQSQKGF